MSVKRFNEAFKRLFESVEIDQPTNKSFSNELKMALETKANEMLSQGVSNIKDYEYAFQEVIENLVPDMSWWEVTTLNIFWHLFETRDVMGCVDEIIANLTDEFKEGGLNDVLSDAAKQKAEYEDGMRASAGALVNDLDKQIKKPYNESLIKQLKECLRRLNEAEMSDEDKADSDLIRSMIAKMNKRANAKFSPEEMAVMDKYGIERTNFNKRLWVGNRQLNPDVDGSQEWDWDENGDRFYHHNGDKSKINYADRARKLVPRDTHQIGHSQNRDINRHHRQSRYIPSDTLQDYDRSAQNYEMGKDVDSMKSALWDRKHAQHAIDTADNDYRARVAKAKKTFDDEMARAERDRDYTVNGPVKTRRDNAQSNIDKLLKKKPVNEDIRIYRESDLTDFEFWSGAKDTVKYLTDDELRQMAFILEDTYPEGMTETQINDIFWFEDDWIAEMLGYDSFEALMEERDEDASQNESVSVKRGKKLVEAPIYDLTDDEIEFLNSRKTTRINISDAEAKLIDARRDRANKESFAKLTEIRRLFQKFEQELGLEIIGDSYAEDGFTLIIGRLALTVSYSPTNKWSVSGDLFDEDEDGDVDYGDNPKTYKSLDGLSLHELPGIIRDCDHQAGEPLDCNDFSWDSLYNIVN